MVITERVFRTAAFLLAQAYIQYRLWYIQRRVRTAIRYLDMHVPLGGEASREEGTRLFEFIESVYRNEVPLEQNGRREGKAGGSGPGLGKNIALAGYFIYFHP